MSTESDVPKYVPAAEAGRRLACDPKQIPRFAARGLLTVRRLPGCAPRYLLSDVERLADEATVPASVTAESSQPPATPERNADVDD